MSRFASELKASVLRSAPDSVICESSGADAAIHHAHFSREAATEAIEESAIVAKGVPSVSPSKTS